MIKDARGMEFEVIAKHEVGTNTFMSKHTIYAKSWASALVKFEIDTQFMSLELVSVELKNDNKSKFH